jgi:adenylylsulfate kinase-like enzyme
VYVKASLDEVIRRDVKGLYEKAINGRIENFIGISGNVPYEEPRDPDIVLDTEKLTVKACASALMTYVQKDWKRRG